MSDDKAMAAWATSELQTVELELKQKIITSQEELEKVMAREDDALGALSGSRGKDSAAIYVQLQELTAVSTQREELEKTLSQSVVWKFTDVCWAL